MSSDRRPQTLGSYLIKAREIKHLAGAFDSGQQRRRPWSKNNTQGSTWRGTATKTRGEKELFREQKSPEAPGVKESANLSLASDPQPCKYDAGTIKPLLHFSLLCFRLSLPSACVLST